MYYDSNKVHMVITASLNRGAIAISKDIVRKILNSEEFIACRDYLDSQVEAFKQREEKLLSEVSDMKAMGFNTPDDIYRYDTCYKYCGPDREGMRVETRLSHRKVEITLEDYQDKQDFLAYVLAYEDK